jgi:hypothetical protein
VSFLCKGATSCPEPVVLDEEGRALLVTRTVADENSRQTSGVRNGRRRPSTGPRASVLTGYSQGPGVQGVVSGTFLKWVLVTQRVFK